MPKPTVRPALDPEMIEAFRAETSAFLKEEESLQRRLADGGDAAFQPLPRYWALWGQFLAAIEASRPLPAPQRKVLLKVAELSTRGRCWEAEKLVGLGLGKAQAPRVERLSMKCRRFFPDRPSDEPGAKEKEQVMVASYVWAAKIAEALAGAGPSAPIPVLADLVHEGVEVLCTAERVVLGPSHIPEDDRWEKLFARLVRLSRGPEPKPRKQGTQQRPTKAKAGYETAVWQAADELNAAFSK